MDEESVLQARVAVVSEMHLGRDMIDSKSRCWKVERILLLMGAG